VSFHSSFSWIELIIGFSFFLKIRWKGELMKIAGKVALVTGGASGLGAACVRKLVAEKAKVMIIDMDETKGNELARELGMAAAVFAKADVTNSEQVSVALDLTKTKLGPLRVVINCAGIGPAAKVVGRNGVVPLDHFNKVIQVNLVGTFNVIRLAAQAMMGSEPEENDGRGVIINTASVAAYEGQIGQAAYAASKGGIVSMTLPIAREFASHGIRVVSIAPGLFDTPMMASLPEKVRQELGSSVPFPKRLGVPLEFAQLALQIIENPMLNGSTLRLDGALRMAPK
jgi:3-hydroxyacyl-CoA dehydrogenase/3-hydroxy-2-methylbutyryl-CoA dehydrogenase